MSSPLHLTIQPQGALFALLLCTAACGAGPETAAAGGGDDGGAGTSASTIVGPSSTSSWSSSSSTPSGAGGGPGGDGGAAEAGSAGGSTGEGADAAGAGGNERGSGGSEPVEPCPDFASEVVAITYGPGAGFGQASFPGNVFGGPQGYGATAGSLDVLALGNGGSITLGFADRRIVDGDGPDFIVFENAFWAGGDPDAPYAELGTVEVSADGETWKTFPCTALEPPYGACAGWHPVYANVADNDIDPLDPAVAGGDAFDLADVDLPAARYVRIIDREDQSGFRGMFDLDAVAIVHGSCNAD